MKRWGDETSRAASSVECRAARRVQSSEAHDMQKQNPKTLKRAFLTFRHVCCGTAWVCVVPGVRHVCVSKLNFTGKNLLYWFKEARDGGGIRVNYGRQSELWVAANRVSAVDAALTHTVRLSLSFPLSVSISLTHRGRITFIICANICQKWQLPAASWQFEVASYVASSTLSGKFLSRLGRPQSESYCVLTTHTLAHAHTPHTHASSWCTFHKCGKGQTIFWVRCCYDPCFCCCCVRFWWSFLGRRFRS